jgi:hypothetical protein
MKRTRGDESSDSLASEHEDKRAKTDSVRLSPFDGTLSSLPSAEAGHSTQVDRAMAWEDAVLNESLDDYLSNCACEIILSS